MKLALTIDERPFLHEETAVLMVESGTALPAAPLIGSGGIAALVNSWSRLDRDSRRAIGETIERGANRACPVGELRAPIDPHAKILVVTGRRYASQPFDRSGPIAAMAKFPSACADPGQTLVLPRRHSRFEADAALGIVIGKAGTYFSPADAVASIAGFTLLLDVWDRDAYEEEARTNNGLLAKNDSGLSPVGPAIWLPEDPTTVTLPPITLTVNGIERQSFTLDQLVWRLDEAIAHWSAATLAPGDIVALGAALLRGADSPPPAPIALSPGDRVALQCEPIGTLDCLVTAPGERP